MTSASECTVDDKKTEIPSEQQETKRATNSSSRKKDLQERKTTEEMAFRYNVL
jgi:hypothetical protein